ncbi:MAG: hypothetical protein QXU18_13650, partial [Thermoplasmatales archaeon]
KTVRSNDLGLLNVTINGMYYLGMIAVFPDVTIPPQLYHGGFGGLTFVNGGSEIVMSNVASRYITVSYNSEYNWIPGNGLKFIGTNALGQQVFEVLHEGEHTINISGALLHDYVDWGTALFMNVILPVLLFSTVIRRRKNIK